MLYANPKNYIKKTFIPALLLASSVVVTNAINQKNDTDNKQNIEYMTKNPNTLATEAGLLSLFGLERKRKNKSEEVSEAKKEENKVPKYSGTLPENTHLQLANKTFRKNDSAKIPNM